MLSSLHNDDGDDKIRAKALQGIDIVQHSKWQLPRVCLTHTDWQWAHTMFIRLKSQLLGFLDKAENREK